MRFARRVAGILTFTAMVALGASSISSAAPAYNSSSMVPGQSLTTNQFLTSPNHQFKLVLQGDGNLVEYGPGSRVVWNTATNRTSDRATTLALQTDGNLVLYTTAGRAVWASGTGGFPVQDLALQTDGNLVAYLTTGRAAWTPSTGPIGGVRPWPSWNGTVDLNLGFPSQWTQAGLVSYINWGRSIEGVPRLVLPYNWASLNQPQQLLVIINMEREDRGLPIFPGLNTSLDALAQQGANSSSDPPYSFGIWAGGPGLSALTADALWMYDDGPGGFNLDCTAVGQSGCYGHELNILRTNWSGVPGWPEMGAATAYLSNSTSLTVAELPTYNTGLVFSWAQELPYLP